MSIGTLRLALLQLLSDVPSPLRLEQLDLQTTGGLAYCMVLKVAVILLLTLNRSKSDRAFRFS